MTISPVKELQCIASAPQGTLIAVSDEGHFTIISTLGRFIRWLTGLLSGEDTFSDCKISHIASRIEKLCNIVLEENPYQAVQVFPALITKLRSFSPRNAQNRSSVEETITKVIGLNNKLQPFAKLLPIIDRCLNKLNHPQTKIALAFRDIRALPGSSEGEVSITISLSEGKEVIVNIPCHFGVAVNTSYSFPLSAKKLEFLIKSGVFSIKHKTTSISSDILTWQEEAIQTASTSNKKWESGKEKFSQAVECSPFRPDHLISS